MKLLIFVAADWANVTADNKLNIMGIFNEIRANKFPASHPSMHLVIRLLAELGEFGQERDLTILLQDPDGQELGKFLIKVKVPTPEGGARAEVNAVFNIRGVAFKQPGPHQFIVLVDKDYKGDLPINLVEVTPPQPS